MDFRGQPEILNAEDYGLSGTEPVINQECMLVHEKSGHYVKLSGTAIIDNITASGRMRTRANKNYVASVSVFTSVVARRASLALSNALGARMCQGTFFALSR